MSAVRTLQRSDKAAPGPSNPGPSPASIAAVKLNPKKPAAAVSAPAASADNAMQPACDEVMEEKAKPRGRPRKHPLPAMAPLLKLTAANEAGSLATHAAGEADFLLAGPALVAMAQDKKSKKQTLQQPDPGLHLAPGAGRPRRTTAELAKRRLKGDRDAAPPDLFAPKVGRLG